jgi:hypothetical protein
LKRERYNGGQWTESRFHSFIKSALRRASVRWPPRYETLADAFVGSKINSKTGRMAKHYRCSKCGFEFPLKEVQVNHIEPVVPVEGFDDWDDVIYRMFCEKNGLEVLCVPCHKLVTQEENILRKKHK